MLLALPLLAVAQMSIADLKELRKYRYGMTAAGIEAMGEDAFERFFLSKTPDGDAGPYQGVAKGVFVDAYRENTARRYRAVLPPNVQTRLLELDRQIRFIGVLFARDDWTLSGGGNAFDPESDYLPYAKTERRLYTQRSGKPDPAGVRRSLAKYRTASFARAPAAAGGSFGTAAQVRARLASNLAKIDGARRKAERLCRTAAERSILDEFLAAQARLQS